MNETPLQALQQKLESWWAEFIEANPKCGLASPPSLLPEIDERDAEGFLRGFEEGGLFTIENGYHFHTELAPPTSKGTPRDFHLFDVGLCRLDQESISHCAAAVELVHVYNWGRSRVLFQSPKSSHLPALAVDLIVLDKAGGQGVYIVGEAKDTPQKLEKLIGQIRACPGFPHPGHKREDHRKCQALEEFRPRYFFGVAAGTRRAFEFEEGKRPSRILNEVSVERLMAGSA